MRATSTWDKACYEIMMLLVGSRMGDLVEQTDSSSPSEADKNVHAYKQLDKTTIKLLLQIHKEARKITDYSPSSKLRQKIIEGDLTQFTDSEQEQLAIEMMLVRNKVTHIYELIKAYGSSTQIRAVKHTEKWRRIDSIAAKHTNQYSVNPFTGKYSKGENHTPLVYYNDPRDYSPEGLREYLATQLVGCDPRIVQGWFDAVISGRES